MLYEEVIASSLIKVDLAGNIIEKPDHGRLHHPQRRKSTRILVRHIDAKRLLLIPLPDGRTRSVGNESRCVEMIDVTELRLRRLKQLGDQRPCDPEKCTDRNTSNPEGKKQTGQIYNEILVVKLGRLGSE
jgi:hypothetical protein